MIIIPKTDFTTQFTTEPTTSDTFCIKYQGEWVKYNSDSNDFSLTSNPNEASVFQYGGNCKTLVVDSTNRMCVVAGISTPATGWYTLTTQTGSGFYNVRVSSFTSSNIDINLGSYSTSSIRGKITDFRIEDGKLQGYFQTATSGTYTLAFTFYDSTSLTTLPIQYDPYGIEAVIIDGDLYYGSWPTPPVVQAKLYGGQWFSDNYIRLNSNIKHVVFANTANVPSTNIVDVTSNFTEGVNYDGPVHFAEWTDPNDNTTITVYVHSNDTIYMQDNEWAVGKYGVRELFDDCANLITIAFNNLDISACTDARSMFYGCNALTTVSGTWDTSNLTSTYGMFNRCYALTSFPNIVFGANHYTAANMFQYCQSLVNASNITFPSTAGYYNNMFGYCDNLTTPPALTCTTLSGSCYSYMFQYCTSLTTTPALPATILQGYCYQGMFYRCTALTTISTMAGTTLENYCYNKMFEECTSLTSAPALPATSVAEMCYAEMFKGCTSLTSAPALPATDLSNGSHCYDSMFMSTALTIPPALPATTLSIGCYTQMFTFCPLTSINELPALDLPNGCYSNMYNSTGVTVSTTQDATHTTAFRVPSSGSAGTVGSQATYYMFANLNPLLTLDTTYYVNASIVSV